MVKLTLTMARDHARNDVDGSIVRLLDLNIACRDRRTLAYDQTCNQPPSNTLLLDILDEVRRLRYHYPRDHIRQGRRSSGMKNERYGIFELVLCRGCCIHVRLRWFARTIPLAA